MKKLVTAISITLALFNPAFGSSTPENLRIAISDGYPPFSSVNSAGELEGFDVDIARALCSHLNTNCEIIRYEWQQMIPGLRAGKFDAIVSSMSITDKRKELVSFTNRYYSNVVRFLARRNSGFDDTRIAGKTIGVAPGTVSSDWLDENLKDIATIHYIEGQDESYKALAEGRIDALFGDGLGFFEWLESPQGAAFEFIGNSYRLDEGIGIAVRKHDDELRKHLNNAIDAILRNGVYREINARYFPFSIY